MFSRTFFSSTLVFALALGSTANANPCNDLLNPLLKIADTEDKPFDYPRFNDFYFANALPKALALAKARVQAVSSNQDAPTFENTILALSDATEDLDPIQSIFSSYLSMVSNPRLEKLAERINPQISKFSNSILFNDNLFGRVKAVYDQREKLNLTVEQRKLLENTYRSFTRNGALLSEADKKRIDEIDARLSVATDKFSQNINSAIYSFKLVVTDEHRLRGIKDDVLAAAKKLATEKGEPKAWYFTLLPASVSGILDYAEDRALREEMWKANQSKATEGAVDNRPLAIEIAQLRQKRAQILGYSSHAQYTTEERMAQSPETVKTFLERLKNSYRPVAEKEKAELQAFANSKGFQGEVLPWDVNFYSEMLKAEKYSYDADALRDYFPFEAVLNGALKTASRLFHVKFIERKDLPVWHPTVKAYEVQSESGEHLGYYYNDPYSRPGKRPGAWMTTTQDQGLIYGRNKRPHVLNVLNLTPPTEDKPSLLTIDDVRTVFHELGHGLHGLLTQGTYRSLTGTSVAWDFVELPSQLNELWAIDPEVMQTYAHHYKTGEVIPLDLIEKVRRSDEFQAGMLGLGQARLGAIDMAWYSTDVSWMSKPEDVVKLEDTIKDYVLYPAFGTTRSQAFGHIFSGGYSGGYYSYKWADVLVADAFELFQEKGLFDEATADSYLRNILRMGGIEKAAELYRRFRGREADPDALLRREGLLPK